MSCFVMRAGGTPLRYVMGCHDLHARGAYAMACPGMGSGYSIPFPGLLIFGMGLPPQSVFVPFLPPPAAPGGGTLIRAYLARARARVGAGAVRAPDCPRARGRTQGARLPSVPREFFAPGATGTKPPPDGVLFLRPDPAIVAHMSTPVTDIVQDMRTKYLHPPHARLVPAIRFRRRAGPGHACRKTGEIAGRAVPQPAQTG